MNFLKILLLFTVFLIPLLGNFNGFGYEQIKIAFFTLSISLIGFVLLFQKPDIKLTEIGKTAAVFILILFLTSLGGLDFKASFLGSPASSCQANVTACSCGDTSKGRSDDPGKCYPECSGGWCNGGTCATCQP